jgi:hypothetical protein
MVVLEETCASGPDQVSPVPLAADAENDVTEAPGWGLSYAIAALCLRAQGRRAGTFRARRTGRRTRHRR